MAHLYNIFLSHPLISTDSRNIAPGSIFFALKGPNFDGNRYAADALEKGAAYVVVDDSRVAITDKYLVVEDTLEALQHLATYHRRVVGIPVLAITGSNGKTTTKELVARVLSKRYRVTVTEGNKNNTIGVPLTLLSIPRDSEFCVVEMGASALGDIAELCSIARPDFGLITNIGRAHMEGFGSMEGVGRGKGELYDYLSEHNGVAFVPKEDTTLTQMADKRLSMRCVYYSYELSSGIDNPLAGQYNRYNIAAAVAAGEYFGVKKPDIVDAIESYVPDNHRSQRVATQHNTLILDCYNANPSSMRTAIADFASDAAVDKSVILGDMLELGPYAADEHTHILRLLGEYGFQDVYLVGKNFTEAAHATGLRAFEDIETLRVRLGEKPIRSRTILLKGSRGIGLEKIIDLL